MSSAVLEHGLTDPDVLPDREWFWRDRYDWLKNAGYQLRPRYKPDWIPSWKGTALSRFRCEDNVRIVTYQILDATRIVDGSTVMLKMVKKSQHPYESDIGVYLSSPPLDSDPRNHCCPILAVLDDPLDNDVQLLVMPLLRTFDDPKLATIGEAVDFFRQTFEGLLFMHEHHVAHRDISSANVMMDPRPILSDFHPQATALTRDITKFVSPRSRTAYPVKYYFTDFGLSRRYGPEETNPLEIPIAGGDRTVPEFGGPTGKTTPRNPFHTDIYYMGSLIRTKFLETYSNLKFMEPLVARMVQDEPSLRPTMKEVMTSFNDILRGLPGWKLRLRLVERKDNFAMNFVKSVHHVATRTAPFVWKGHPAIPTPKAQ